MVHKRNASSTRITIPPPRAVRPLSAELHSRQGSRHAIASERSWLDSLLTALRLSPGRPLVDKRPASLGSAAVPATSTSQGSKRRRTYFHCPLPSTRLSKRQLTLLILVLSAAIYLLHATGYRIWGTHGNSRKRAAKNVEKPPPGSPPKVDRKVLDKLQAIEEAQGGEDQDEYEAREAGRLSAPMDPNAPPLLYSLPDGRLRPKATAVTATLPVDADAERELARLASVIPSETLDEQYCPLQTQNLQEGLGCKFLLAGWVGEQETKAQMHLHQLGLLAVALNRTLVLPNVSKSRMMSCASQSFDFYYQADALDSLGIPTISFERWVEWTSRREDTPSAQVVSTVNYKADHPSGALEIESGLPGTTVPTSPKRKLCLDPPNAYLDFTKHSPMSIFPPQGWHKSQEGRDHFGESVVHTLSSRTVMRKAFRSSSKQLRPSEPDTLILNYEVRWPILTAELVETLPIYRHPSSTALLPFAHLPYSSTWTDLAQQVSRSLSPFIAIHWRQETLPTSIIAPCASALVDTLVKTLSAQPDVKNVYLAADYPIEDLMQGKHGVSAAHSGTFGKLLTEEHHVAMDNFLREFRRRLTNDASLKVRLTTFSNEQTLGNIVLPSAVLSALKQESQSSSGSSQPSLAEFDPGLLGIVDKLVASQAELFLTGLPMSSSSKEGPGLACGKESSFTKQIWQTREQAREAREGQGEESRLRNIVDHWSRSERSVLDTLEVDADIEDPATPDEPEAARDDTKA